MRDTIGKSTAALVNVVCRAVLEGSPNTHNTSHSPCSPALRSIRHCIISLGA